MTELNNDIIDRRRAAKVDDGALNAIGVDIGRTKTAAGVVAPEGKILNEVRYPTADDPEQLVRSTAQAIRFQITIENDASAAAWGEFRLGSGSDVDHLVFVTLGTDVRGDVISHGTLLRGALGHVTIQTNGPRCGCGNCGCLESLTSGTATLQPWPATPTLASTF